MRCASSFERIAAAVGLTGAQLPVEAGEGSPQHRRGASDLDVEVGGLQPIAQAARGVVQLDLVGLRPEVPRAADVGRDRLVPDREHDVRRLVHLFANAVK